MRLIVLTSDRFTTASRCLPALCQSPRLQVVGVVLAHAVTPDRRRRWRRKVRKVLRIGPLGALNGVRIRPWYQDKGAEDIELLAKQFGAPFYQTEAINSDRTVRLFQELRADLGLSLGNGYIGRRVFSIPGHGMINIHGELLPRFQGAHSVIWPIHEGIEETGFTIHRIDDGIDTGDILYQERLPIAFRPTLRETVEASIGRMRPRVPPALVRVCEDFEAFAARARRQEGGRSYTTPTLGQFLRMARNHRRMYLEAARGAQSGGGDARERRGPG